MSDEEIVDLAKAYVMMLIDAAIDDEEMSKVVDMHEHRTGLVIGFVRGYRACEQLRQSPTLQPGSN